MYLALPNFSWSGKNGNFDGTIYLLALEETNFTNPYRYISDVFNNFSTLCSLILRLDNDITRKNDCMFLNYLSLSAISTRSKRVLDKELLLNNVSRPITKLTLTKSDFLLIEHQ